MRRERDEANRRLDLALAGRGDPVRTQPQAAPEPDPLPDMPNPATDPSGYQSWLAQRDERTIQQHNARIDAGVDRATAAARGERLWSEFKSEHPEYAEMEPLVREEVANYVQERGGQLPPEAQLKADVHERMQARLKRTGLVAEPKPADPPADPPQGNEADRTQGTHPSNAQAPQPTPADPKDPEDEEKGLIDQVEDIQEQAGLI